MLRLGKSVLPVRSQRELLDSTHILADSELKFHPRKFTINVRRYTLLYVTFHFCLRRCQ